MARNAPYHPLGRGEEGNPNRARDEQGRQSRAGEAVTVLWLPGWVPGTTRGGSAGSKWGPLHLVSAWSTEANLTLGQVAVLYDYRVGDAIDQLRECALKLRQKYLANAHAEENLHDVTTLKSLYENLEHILPAGVKNVSDFARHLGWIENNIKRDLPQWRIGRERPCDSPAEGCRAVILRATIG
jgi:hypothetical protein